MSPRGLSLIELVVAMALFALVAVIGAQALTVMLRSRDALETRSAETEALARATTLLRADLAAAVPALFHPPDASRPHSALSAGPDGFSLSVGGQPLRGADPAAPRLHRVDWTLRDGRLARRVWPVLRPGPGARPEPAQPLHGAVTALALRSFWPGSGWVDGLAPPGAGPRGVTDALPRAVEVTLMTETHGAIPIIEALR